MKLVYDRVPKMLEAAGTNVKFPKPIYSELYKEVEYNSICMLDPRLAAIRL